MILFKKGFDHKNELIKFRRDEYKWWPWLGIDTSTYNTGGSCLGKRNNWLFLEDCYKKMAFACQTKPKPIKSQSKSAPRIQFKCGSGLGQAASVLARSSTFQTTQTTTSATTTMPPFFIQNNQQPNDTSFPDFSKQSILEINNKTSNSNSSLRF